MLISLPNLEIYLIKPTTYLLLHRQSLIPDWNWDWQTNSPILILFLLQAKFPLLENSEIIQDEKDRLLGKFIRLSQKIKSQSNQQNILTETIFPVDGKPLFSKIGNTAFNLPALIQESLGFPTEKTAQGCQVFIHPCWHHAVYPGMLLINASIETTKKLVFHAYENQF